MDFWDAIILGIIEGLTEFLPISSTGHMILANQFLNLSESEQAKAFEVIIQSGAMFAVIWHYRNDLFSIFRGVFQGDKKSRQTFSSIFVAFLPAMVLGALFAKAIKAHLFGTKPVAWALLVGGILMILIERRWKSSAQRINYQEVPLLKSLSIGLAQCLALWPGFSRAMATILGGRLAGLSTKDAAEFSFLLAIPTLFAAAAHDAIKLQGSVFASTHDVALLLVGLVVSFITALVVIRSFLKFLTTHSMEVFGWYRVLIGLIFLVAFT